METLEKVSKIMQDFHSDSNNIQQELSAGETTNFRNFKERVMTFDPSQWYGKPLWLNPLQLSRYGWTMVNKNLLKCSICNAHASTELPSLLNKSIYDKSVERLKKSLILNHNALCLMRSRPCPNSYMFLDWESIQDAREYFIEKITPTISYSKQLPFIDTTTMDKIGLTEKLFEILKNIFNDKLPKNIDCNVAKSAAALTICGWSILNSGSEFYCSMCNRRMTIRQFITLNDDFLSLPVVDNKSNIPEELITFEMKRTDVSSQTNNVELYDESIQTEINLTNFPKHSSRRASFDFEESNGLFSGHSRPFSPRETVASNAVFGRECKTSNIYFSEYSYIPSSNNNELSFHCQKSASPLSTLKEEDEDDEDNIETENPPSKKQKLENVFEPNKKKPNSLLDTILEESLTETPKCVTPVNENISIENNNNLNENDNYNSNYESSSEDEPFVLNSEQSENSVLESEQDFESLCMLQSVDDELIEYESEEVEEEEEYEEEETVSVNVNENDEVEVIAICSSSSEDIEDSEDDDNEEFPQMDGSSDIIEQRKRSSSDDMINPGIKRFRSNTVKRLFNPINEHRKWCPWICPHEENRQAGYKAFSNAILDEVPPGVVRRFPMFAEPQVTVENVRSIKRLLREWAEPNDNTK